jgi:SPP1 gp7 family putative phage head morphogenesis protein
MATKTLQAQAWDTATTPKAIPPQMYNIIADNVKILTDILNISQKELETLAKTFKNPEQLQQMLQGLINRGFIGTSENLEVLNTFQNNIGIAFQTGLAQAGGTPSPVMSLIQTTMIDSVMNYVTRMDTDLKKQLGQILADGYAQKQFPPQIIKKMKDEVGITKARAGMIARTETMRSSNMANWSQAKVNGATHFIVDSRAAACKYCRMAFSGRVFSIDETKYIPPFHPNCACVPIFFYDETEAQNYLDRVNKRNEKERKLLTKQGHKLPSDGTGPNALGKEQHKIIEKVLAES